MLRYIEGGGVRMPGKKERCFTESEIIEESTCQ